MRTRRGSGRRRDEEGQWRRGNKNSSRREKRESEDKREKMYERINITQIVQSMYVLNTH